MVDFTIAMQEVMEAEENSWKLPPIEKKQITIHLKGGAGSGNFSHSGRPGLVGGSGEGINSKAFKDWFRNSKIVNADGSPRIVYHGTPKGGFTKFDLEMAGYRGDKGISGKGFYFSDSPILAGIYTDAYQPNQSQAIYSVYLSLQNPYDLGVDALNLKYGSGHSIWGDELRNAIINAGFDGVIRILPDGESTEYVAFYPTQIKSSTGNMGTYDPNNPDITKQVAIIHI